MLIDDEVAWPVKMTANYGSDFVYVHTVSSEAPIQHSVTLIRMGKPALASNYAKFPSVADSSFAAYGNNQPGFYSILQMISPDGTSTSKKIFDQPKMIVTATIDDSSFKKNFNYGLTVKTPKSMFTVNSTVEVINFQAPVKPSGETTTIKLPSQTNNLEVEVNLDDWFIGPVSNYSISCPACDDEKVKLSNHFTKVAELNISVSNQFLNFASDKIIWTLTPQTIIFMSEEGKLQGNYKFDVSSTTNCKDWTQWDNNIVMVYCIGVNEQSFHIVKSNQNHTDVAMVWKVPIEAIYWVDSISEIQTDHVGRVFVLDNNAEANGKGTVTVFKVTNQVQMITG